MFNPHINFKMSTITCNEEMNGNDKYKILVLSHPLGNLGVTYRIHLWLGGIEFFSLTLMTAALLSEICRNQFSEGLVTAGGVA